MSFPGHLGLYHPTEPTEVLREARRLTFNYDITAASRISGLQDLLAKAGWTNDLGRDVEEARSDRHHALAFRNALAALGFIDADVLESAGIAPEWAHQFVRDPAGTFLRLSDEDAQTVWGLIYRRAAAPAAAA